MLSGCAADGGKLFAVPDVFFGKIAQDQVDAPTIQTARPVGGWVDEQLIRAPELFNASGLTQWNGRRTSRGIWAAHPRARGTRKVRMINGRTGAEVDGVVYQAKGKDDRSDLVTLSSDAALILGLTRGDTASISLVGLRPQGSQSPLERAQVENRAEGELVAHISQLDDPELLKLLAASMRAMGYDTRIADGPDRNGEPSIRAVRAPVNGVDLPAVRGVVRPLSSGPAAPAHLKQIGEWLEGSPDLAVLVSVPGFAPRIAAGEGAQDPRIHLVDLETLVNLWLTHYEQLAPEDQALLPLQPIYFVASDAAGRTSRP